jgi:hypothetical protein
MKLTLSLLVVGALLCLTEWARRTIAKLQRARG